MIKYVILDIDGTLTDGCVYIGNDGELCKGFYVRDGLGIQVLIKNNITPIILTSRQSDIVINRCKELGITEIFQGIKNKKEAVMKILTDKNVEPEEIAYMADDINDYEAIQVIGLPGCPADAVMEIKNVCSFISNYNGGHGAVREFCEYIISTNGLQFKY